MLGYSLLNAISVEQAATFTTKDTTSAIQHTLKILSSVTFSRLKVLIVGNIVVINTEKPEIHAIISFDLIFCATTLKNKVF